MSDHFKARFLHAARLTAARYPFYVPLGLLCLVSVLFRWTNLDVQIASRFYNFQMKSWSFADKNPWEFIDEWFVFPGMILGIASLMIASYGLIWRKKTEWTRGASLIALVLLIGPGLLVNGTLKPAFSRPRPREIVQLGGTQQYQPIFGFGEETDFNASFPSGHASIGFFLIAPAFLFRRKQRIRRMIFAAGILFGSIMGLSRIVQGGHYLSDVIWSLSIIYFTAWFVHLMLLTADLKENSNSDTDVATSSETTSKTFPALPIEHVAKSA